MDKIEKSQQKQTSLTYSQVVKTRTSKMGFVKELAEAVVRFTCDLANKVLESAPNIEKEEKAEFKHALERWATILANHHLKVKLSPSIFHADDRVTSQSTYITEELFQSSDDSEGEETSEDEEETNSNTQGANMES